MTVSSGIAMEIHYCMGEKAGIDYYKNTDDKCGRCGMKEQNKKGCCSDDHKFVKIQDSHQQADNLLNFGITEIAFVSSFITYDWTLPVENAAGFLANHSPPLYAKPPARILHGIFRI
jgi:hypothetical protein